MQVKRQFDLIPELVDTAQPYMRHEQALLEKLLELRSGLDSRKQSRAELVELTKHYLHPCAVYLIKNRKMKAYREIKILKDWKLSL